MNAIETLYSGVRFRSRLEARWAVFFDAAGIDWKYEVEGYEKGSVRYLPDFEILLGNRKYWVEVKGDPDWIRDSKQKLIWMHSPESILPEFDKSGLIVLGDIPKSGNLGPLIFPILSFVEELFLSWSIFSGANYEPQLAGSLLRFHSPKKISAPLCVLPEESLGFQPEIVPMWHGIPGVIEPLDAARSARFEHGESGGWLR